jgi:hypothetical protein
LFESPHKRLRDSPYDRWKDQEDINPSESLSPFSLLKQRSFVHSLRQHPNRLPYTAFASPKEQERTRVRKQTSLHYWTSNYKSFITDHLDLEGVILVGRYFCQIFPFIIEPDNIPGRASNSSASSVFLRRALFNIHVPDIQMSPRSSTS